MSRVLCLYGGPGAGKSTQAAKLYVEAKVRGESVELVREAVKELAWSGRRPSPIEQLCFLTEQIRRESCLLGCAETIITDAPVLLVAFYVGVVEPTFADEALDIARAYMGWAESQGHTFEHRRIDREHPYDATARYSDEDEAVKLDEQISLFFDEVLV